MKTFKHDEDPPLLQMINIHVRNSGWVHEWIADDLSPTSIYIRGEEWVIIGEHDPNTFIIRRRHPQ